jgi:hypothetical protein
MPPYEQLKDAKIECRLTFIDSAVFVANHISDLWWHGSPPLNEGETQKDPSRLD